MNGVFESSTPEVTEELIHNAANMFHELERKEAESLVPFAIKRSPAALWVPVATTGKDNQLKRAELFKDCILRYLVDTSNDFPTRTELAEHVCGVKLPTLYRHIAPERILEIEQEALRLRRLQYSSELAKVDAAMMKRAQSGDVPAAKLVYERFEGAVSKTLNINHSGEIALKALLDELTEASATAIEVNAEEVDNES